MIRTLGKMLVLTLVFTLLVTQASFNAQVDNGLVEGTPESVDGLAYNASFSDGIISGFANANAEELTQVGIQLRAALTGWNQVQEAINNAYDGETIDLSGFTSGPTSAMTFSIPAGKNLTLKGNPSITFSKVAFIVAGSGNITIDNLNIKSADTQTFNADSKGYSSLHFASGENTLTLVGASTIASGQISNAGTSGYGYGAAVGVPSGVGLVITGIGTLNATGGLYGAGIGGGYQDSAGSITITGGIVYASGGENSAGIGGGNGGSGGNITISNSSVKADGGNYGAGIGGGYQGSGGSIIILGSDVTAKGGIYGTGIGSAYGGYGGSITIIGSTVIAEGGNYSAGIGSSLGGDGGYITISGGIISSTGGSYSAGIGGGGRASGSGGNGGNILIYGDADVTAKKGTSGSSEDIGRGNQGTSSGNIFIVLPQGKLTTASNLGNTVAFSADPASPDSVTASFPAPWNSETVTILDSLATETNMSVYTTFTTESVSFTLGGGYPGVTKTGSELKAADAAVEFILPTLTGAPSITIDGSTLKIGATLTADISVLPADMTGVTYLWQADGENVGVNSDSYTVAASDVGKAITVTVSAMNYKGSVTSAATDTVPYTIKLIKSGATGADDVFIGVSGVMETYVAGNDSATITYVLDSSGTKSNAITYSGGAINSVIMPGTGTSSYTVNEENAINGVISITATFSHENMRSVTIDEAAQTVTFDGSVQQYALTGTGAGLGGFSITYNQGDGSVIPTNAGTYNVAIHREADRIYTEYDRNIIGGLVITPKPLTISGATHTRAYDGTTDATGITAWTFSDFAINDDAGEVAVSDYTAVFTSANAGTTAVNITAMELGGAKAGNYVVALPANNISVTGGITKKDISINTVAAPTKTYDGTLSATAGEVTFSGEVAGHSLTAQDFTASAVFTGSDAAGTGNKDYTYTVTLHDTESANNYNLIAATKDGSDGTIEKAAGLMATPPAVIFISESDNVARTFDLDSIVLNKSDCGARSYALNGVLEGSVDVLNSNPTLSGIGNATLAYQGNGERFGSVAQSITITTANYDDVTVIITFSASEKGDISSHITFTNGSGTYSRTELSYENASIDGIAQGANPAWKYTYSVNSANPNGAELRNGKPFRAGNYIVTAAYEDDNSRGNTKTFFTVNPKLLTVNVSVGDKPFDGTNSAAITLASLEGVEAGDSVTLSNGVPTFSSVDAADNIAIVFTEFSISGADATNYSLIQPNGVTANIKAGFKPDKNIHYTTTALNANGWTNGDYTITAATGYQVSATNTAAGSWSASLIYGAETDNGNVYFYVKDTTSGEISLSATETYKLDKTAPKGTIAFKSKSFTEFADAIIFEMFFKDTVDVTVTGTDELSGVGSVMYLTSETSLPDTTDWDSQSWMVYDSGVSLTQGFQGCVYARITDYAGNVIIINTNGIIVYEDSTADTVNISYAKSAVGDITARVNLNGNTIEKITNGMIELMPGTDYTISGNTITFTVTYLDTLAAGNYTLNIHYKPLGETYVDDFENEAPAATSLALAVVLAREEAPNVIIDYIAERISGLTAGETYNLNGTYYTADGSGKIGIAPGFMGATLSIVKKGNGTITADSELQNLVVPLRPAPPTGIGKMNTTSGRNNGAITGVNSTMEYRSDTASTWTEISGTSVTGLPASIYQVRLKAVPGSSFASAPVNVIIAVGSSGSVSGGIPSISSGGSLVSSGGSSPVSINSDSHVVAEEAIASDTLRDASSNTGNDPSGSVDDGDEDSSNSSATLASLQTVEVKINGQPIAAMLGDDGILTLSILADNIGDHKNDTGVFEVEMPQHQYHFNINIQIAALSGDHLNITTDFGIVQIPNAALQTLREKYGDTLCLVISRGSFKIILLDEKGMEIAFNDPINPFTVNLPYALGQGEITQAVVAVDTNGKIIPFATYKDGYVSFTISETGTYDVIYNKQSFNDVSEHWALGSIDFVAARSLYVADNGDYMPDGIMTRAMFAQILANLDGADLSGYTTSRFNDLPSGQRYLAAVEWAADKGIVSGVGNCKFDPDAGINREQIAVMLANYLRYKGHVFPVGMPAEFADEAAISPWAYEAVKAVQAAEIICGRPRNIFDPQGMATRAEVATIISRVIQAK